MYYCTDSKTFWSGTKFSLLLLPPAQVFSFSLSLILTPWKSWPVFIQSVAPCSPSYSSPLIPNTFLLLLTNMLFSDLSPLNLLDFNQKLPIHLLSEKNPPHAFRYCSCTLSSFFLAFFSLLCSLLPAIFSIFHLDSWTHFTHSEGPPAHPRTASTSRFAAAYSSESSPFFLYCTLPTALSLPSFLEPQ